MKYANDAIDGLIIYDAYTGEHQFQALKAKSDQMILEIADKAKTR